MRRSRSVALILGCGEFWLPVGGPAGNSLKWVLAVSPAILVGGRVSTGRSADHNSDGVVYSIAQLYLGATVVCRKPVVPHWDCSGIHLLYSTLLQIC